MHAGADSRGGDSPALSETLTVVLGALYDLNRHRDADTLAQKIVTVVPRTITCDSAIFARIEPATLSFTFSSWPADRFAAVDHKDAARLHLQDHPLVAHFRVRRNAKAWSLHDLVSRAAFQRTTLYRTLYRPLGIEFQLVLLVPYPDRAPRALVLNRRDTPFSEGDRELLELLWPHLTQAVRRSRAAARQRGVPEIDGLSAGRGVVLLDRTGKVQLCTEQARIWLTRYCLGGFSRREIRSLPEPIAGWVAQALADHMLQSRGISEPPAPLILRRGDQYLAMRLVADHARGQHLLLMEEASMNTPPDLLLGLGLTPREAEVLAWVAQGKTNRETGIILGMSTRTVQKHLERVFTKLGVESRTGAILKAWQIGRFEDLGARAKAQLPRER
jgi:DNA-binding CsgD family transcriptional regulator